MIINCTIYIFGFWITRNIIFAKNIENVLWKSIKGIDSEIYNYYYLNNTHGMMIIVIYKSPYFHEISSHLVFFSNTINIP